MTATLAPEIVYRPARLRDVPAMARLREQHWGSAVDWELYVAQYLNGERNPRHAKAERVAILAVEDDQIVGFIAGHLTRRHKCDGELQWINVSSANRGQGIASELLRQLSGWFVENDAHRVCVEVLPSNSDARSFYNRVGAEQLSEHWLVFPDISGAIVAK